MDSSEEEELAGLPHDEVREIKRAMKVAQARKQALSQQMKIKLDRHSADQSEMEMIVKKQAAELSRTKALLSQTDFDLREARYEINQILARETTLKEEKRIMDQKSAETIAELRAQLESKHRTQEERVTVAVFECDKLIKTLASVYRSVFDGRSASSALTPKTTRQLLDKATRDAEHLRDFLQSKSSALLSEEQEHVIQAKNFKKHAESGCDNALLDMCRSLEEENRALSDTVDALRAQLAEASRDASINKLIPHYRLAIVRSRTYAANLQEQVKREQATSQTLREQLEATYADLKKAVEEKRAMYSRLSKRCLQQEERESYLAHQRAVDEQTILRDAIPAAPSPPTAPAASGSHGYAGSSDYLSSDLDRAVGPAGQYLGPAGAQEGPASGSDAALRVQSRYLQALQEPPRNPPTQAAATVPAGESKQSEVPPTASIHLKAEISQLDREIEELKTKLSKAAMLKSQRILTEVLDAQNKA